MVALIDPEVANEQVEFLISGFDETGFALNVGIGKREVLTPCEANAAEVTAVHYGRARPVRVWSLL